VQIVENQLFFIFLNFFFYKIQKYSFLFLFFFWLASLMAAKYHGSGIEYDNGDMRFPCYTCRGMHRSKDFRVVFDLWLCEKCAMPVWNLVMQMRKQDEAVLQAIMAKQNVTFSGNKK